MQTISLCDQEEDSVILIHQTSSCPLLFTNHAVIIDITHKCSVSCWNIFLKRKKEQMERHRWRKEPPAKFQHILVFLTKNEKLQKSALNLCVFIPFGTTTYSAPRFSVISRDTEEAASYCFFGLSPASAYYCWYIERVGDNMTSCFLNSHIMTTALVPLKFNSCSPCCYVV